MHVLYLYDIKAKNKKKFNRVKRRFYYHLNKLPLNKEHWRTKSAIAVPTNLEAAMDNFFKMFGRSVVVYKIIAESIEALD
jgi:hypothetical protein